MGRRKLPPEAKRVPLVVKVAPATLATILALSAPRKAGRLIDEWAEQAREEKKS